jgi:hypothetical protein
MVVIITNGTTITGAVDQMAFVTARFVMVIL